MKFTELKIKPEILKALNDMGFVELTPIQELTFSPVLEGRDILALAETGSGKTSACAIPLVGKIDPGKREIQALILVPTRELALQYVDEIGLIARHLKISPFAIYGGFSMDIQRAKLTDGVHILVATPGRLIDHLYNSELSLSFVETLVLDEADEMLDKGFIDDVRFIMSCIIKDHQTLLFSATMPEEIDELASSSLCDPIKIELNREIVSPVNISHHFQFIHHNRRVETVRKYLETHEINQAILFCNSRRNGEAMYSKLKSHFSSIDYIHGGMDQSRRTSIFDNFKKNRFQLLLATDVAGRGLDFSQVSHIINVDFPNSVENYIHRTGRTGRMGKVGLAMSFMTRQNIKAFKALVAANPIEVVWEGKPPDLERYSGNKGSKGRKAGKKFRLRRNSGGGQKSKRSK